MERGNQQSQKLSLLGFTEDPNLQPLLFRLFLSMYLVTFTGNLAIILAIISDSHLHTPHVLFSQTCPLQTPATSTTIPKILWNIQKQSKLSPMAGCLSQVFFFIVFGCLDNLPLVSRWPMTGSGHLSPSALHGHHELPALWATGSWGPEPQCHRFSSETLTILRLSFSV